MSKKYELTQESIEINGHTLHRIRALRTFGGVQAGNLGGYVESEKNLSHEGICWIFRDARVYGTAQVYENARIFGNTRVYGTARVYGNARVGGSGQVYGNARVYENALVFGKARIYDDANVFGYSKIDGNTYLYGDAHLCITRSVYFNYIYGDAKIDHGIWTHHIMIAGKDYLVSSTLEKILLK